MQFLLEKKISLSFLMIVSRQIKTNFGVYMQMFPFYVDLLAKHCRKREETCFKYIFLHSKLLRNPVFGVQSSFLQPHSPVISLNWVLGRFARIPWLSDGEGDLIPEASSPPKLALLIGAGGWGDGARLKVGGGSGEPGCFSQQPACLLHLLRQQLCLFHALLPTAGGCHSCRSHQVTQGSCFAVAPPGPFVPPAWGWLRLAPVANFWVASLFSVWLHLSLSAPVLCFNQFPAWEANI